MVVLCSTVQRLPLIDLRWKSRLWVDFKIVSVLIASFITSAAGQEKQNENLNIAMKKWEQLQLNLGNSKSEAGKGDY